MNDVPSVNDVIALYPTARKVEDWLKRNSRGRSLLDYPIMTFPQLVDRLWREFGPRGAMLDELQERLAADEAMDDARETLGSADHVLGLIRQFKSAALTPADLRAAARALAPGGDASGIRDRIAGLSDAFERYERLLAARGLCDRHDRERVVLEQLLALEQSGARPALLDGVRQSAGRRDLRFQPAPVHDRHGAHPDRRRRDAHHPGRRSFGQRRDASPS